MRDNLTPTRNAIALRNLYGKRHAAGLCIRCGEKRPESNVSRCGKCKEENSLASKKYYRELIERREDLEKE